MGYACPVCETPHPDTEHLANHLAFTALLGDEDHEDWLAERFPDWEEAGERELAGELEAHAKEVEYPQVFEDTTGNHDHRHDDEVRGGDLFDDESQFETAARRAGGGRGGAGAGVSGQLDAEAQQILQEAQQMTEQMVEEEADETDDERADEDETE